VQPAARCSRLVSRGITTHNRRTRFLPIILVILTAAAGAPDQGTTIVTLRGEKFEKAVVTRVEPDSITIAHSAGVARVPFTELSAEIQKKYGYDVSKAAEYREALMRIARAQAEAEAQRARIEAQRVVDKKLADRAKRERDVRIMELMDDPVWREQALKQALHQRYIEKGY